MMDGGMFNKLPVTGIMWFAVLGMAVAGILAGAVVGGLAYLLVKGVLAVLS